MSDEIDTDMIEDSGIVIEKACTELRATVYRRATREMDRQARHQADDVFTSFDAVRNASHRRGKKVMVQEVDQLCRKLDHAMAWSRINRPFDTGSYEAVLEQVELARGAIYSALGIFKLWSQLIPNHNHRFRNA